MSDEKQSTQPLIGLAPESEEWLRDPQNRALLRSMRMAPAQVLDEAQYMTLEGGRCPTCLTSLIWVLARAETLIALCPHRHGGWTWGKDVEDRPNPTRLHH